MLPVMPKRNVTKEANRVARLSGPGGAFVEFSVVGYEFPARVPLDDHDYDANWLLIQFRVSDGKDIWSTIEPAWLTVPRAWMRGCSKILHPVSTFTQKLK